MPSESLSAGKVAEVVADSGEWVFLDVGFSRTQASCGLLIGDSEPICVQYGAAVRRIVQIASSGSAVLNLVIEAPLSVAFTPNGNPTGRSVEKRGHDARYWYVGLGTSVMVAALYLVFELRKINRTRDIRLFEGLVSFKGSGTRSSHVDDVTALRDVVRDPIRNRTLIVAPEALQLHEGDVIRSAGSQFGFDFGVPPVLIATPHERRS